MYLCSDLDFQMKFTDYNIAEEIKDNLSSMGFNKPTDIQFKAISHIMNGEDVMGIAQTGTGKTAAFAIPIINTIHNFKLKARRKDGIKCIVMVPTRELAEQIQQVFEEIGRHSKVKTRSIVGGIEQEPQIANLEKGYDVLIATPGRLFDLVSQGHLRLHRVETLILDEADRMLDLGFHKDIKDLIKHLPKRRQTLFFSATINDRVKKLAYSLVRNAIRIQISPKNPVAKNIEHAVAKIEMDDKRYFLERVINENPNQKMLVFVRTKVRAERVKKAMGRVDIDTLTLHGDKDQKERFAAMESFKKGKCNILIATDVSARGIDIPGVDAVINYDLPEISENYVHRVGRTGRGRNKGQAISFCSKEEEYLLDEIEEFTGSKIQELEIKKSEYKETLEFSSEEKQDWKNLMQEDEQFQKKKKRKK
jgi:ATP-dependent RNA helicase RhlE